MSVAQAKGTLIVKGVVVLLATETPETLRSQF